MRPLGPAVLGGLLLAPALLLTGCGDNGAGGPSASGSAVAGEKQEAREPSAIYGRYCVNCHGTGMAGAPMVGPEHRLIWSEEIEEEGFPTLVKIAIEGQNGMPPRGTCFDCSDKEIEATVLYMLKESGAK